MSHLNKSDILLIWFLVHVTSANKVLFLPWFFFCHRDCWKTYELIFVKVLEWIGLGTRHSLLDSWVNLDWHLGFWILIDIAEPGACILILLRWCHSPLLCSALWVWSSLAGVCTLWVFSVWKWCCCWVLIVCKWGALLSICYDRCFYCRSISSSCFSSNSSSSSSLKSHQTHIRSRWSGMTSGHSLNISSISGRMKKVRILLSVRVNVVAAWLGGNVLVSNQHG